MGHRLSRIYTRTGDDGSTGLGDGSRVGKHYLRVETYGTIDELNSHVGVLLAITTISHIRQCLTEIQQTLFDIGGELCLPGSTVINAEAVAWLEAWLDHYNQDLPPLQDFVLPGGNHAAAVCHIVRAVCRRAERQVVHLHQEEKLNPHTLAYLNRLSDFLFVLARVLARVGGHNEPLWQHQRTLKFPED